MSISAFNAAKYNGRIKRCPEDLQRALGLFARYDLPREADDDLIEDRLVKLPPNWKEMKKEIVCFKTYESEHHTSARKLRNPQLREYCRRELDRDNDALLAPLREEAELGAFRGQLYEVTRASLRDKYVNDGFDPAAVARVLSRFPSLHKVPVGTEGVKDVIECLRVLQTSSLPQFLGIPPDAGFNDWQDKAKSMRREYRNKKEGHPKKNAGDALCNMLISAFSSEVGWRRLLNGLAARQVNSISPSVLLVLDGEARKKLVDKARKAGAPAAEILVHQIIAEASAAGGSRPEEKQRAQVAEAKRLASSGRLVTAKSVLASLAEVVPELSAAGKELLAEIDAKFAPLRAKFREAARIAASDPDGAYGLYAEILRVAPDYDDALQAFERCGPSAPRDVRAIVQGNGVRLTWAASRSAGTIIHRVLRSEGSAPVSPEGGTIVAQGTQLVCEDRAVSPGCHYYYSVFARRTLALEGERTADAWSASSAVTGPVTCYADVAGFALQSGDRAVEGSWLPAPPAATGVRVYRHDNDPPGRLDGGVKIAVHGSSFSDRGVRNDGTYYYRIVVEYRDAVGKLVTSHGVVASARPVRPPFPIRLLWKHGLVAAPIGIVSALFLAGIFSTALGSEGISGLAKRREGMRYQIGATPLAACGSPRAVDHETAKLRAAWEALRARVSIAAKAQEFEARWDSQCKSALEAKRQ